MIYECWAQVRKRAADEYEKDNNRFLNNFKTHDYWSIQLYSSLLYFRFYFNYFLLLNQNLWLIQTLDLEIGDEICLEHLKHKPYPILPQRYGDLRNK